jgi:segregation and condensation protein A
MSNYQFKLQDFEGPLELLLTLITNSKLNINEISLAEITDEYLEYIDHNENLTIDEIADFLVIAAKLLYIKSKLILPEAIISIDDEDSADLEKQLKIYKEYYEARKIIKKIINQENFTYSRTAPLIKIKAKFRPPKNITIKDLEDKFRKVINSVKPVIEKPNKKTIDKTINIREKINHIKNLISNCSNLDFSELIKNKENRTEIIVCFLAMLELIKQRTINVNQDSMFEKITINTNNNSPC